MRNYIVLILLAISPLLIYSQSAGISPQPFQGNKLFEANTVAGKFYEPLDVNFQLGTSFGSFGYGGSYFHNYLSPTVAFPVNKKLSLSTGLIFSRTNFNNLPFINSENEVDRFSGAMNSLTLFTSGAYQANERLVITGSAYKTLNPSFNARLNPQALQMEAKGFSVGVNYKLSDNTFIGAEIRYNQGNGNFYNPYNRYYSPLRSSNPFMNDFAFPGGY